MTLVFGPMYHLYTFEDKIQALKKAKRVAKTNGFILVAYCIDDLQWSMDHAEDWIKDIIKN